MKIIRNMSIEELNLLTSGVDIKGRRHNCKSSVKKGVCFFGIENEYQANTWYHDICVVFEADEKQLEKGWGIYPDWATSFDVCILTEYSIDSYNIDTFSPLYWYWKGERNKKYKVK